MGPIAPESLERSGDPKIVRAEPFTLSVAILWMKVGMSIPVGQASTQGASAQ